MSAITALPSSDVRAPIGAGLGLMTGALSLSGGAITLDLFGRGWLSPALAVSWCVAWFLITVASAFALTMGRSPSRRAIDIRRASLVYFLVGFGILSLGWRAQFSGTAGVVDQESVPRALVISQAAVVAWAVGFRFLGLGVLARLMTVARGVAAPPGTWHLRSPYVPVLLYLPSAASTIYRLRAGSFAYLADPNALIASPTSLGPLLSMGEQLGKAAVVIAALGVIQARRYRHRAVIVFALLVAAELGIGAFSGTKAPFILLALAVAVPFFARQARISWKVLAATIIIFSIGTSFTGAYRVRLIETGGRLQGEQALDAFADTSLETLQPTRLFETIADGTLSLGPRLRQIDNVALVAQRSPGEIAYRSPSRLLTDPISNLVPRAIWPSKPVVTTGLDFSREYYNLPSSLLTSSAVTVTGDLFRHGGVGTVIVGMALLGAVVRLVDEHWHPARDLRLSVLYVSVFLTLVNLESAVASMLTGFPLAILTGLLASRLAFASNRDDSMVERRSAGVDLPRSMGQGVLQRTGPSSGSLYLGTSCGI